ncbi:PolC-type DNA polymerase III [Paenibacillus sp. NRS-1782]|uniref:3'-5' exonuclease n=1 Tax=unclassified Paenibacillus TaxID=185978 RepID=UPI003D294525
MNEIVTVIDVETTGLDATTDHITEIAAIRAEVGAGGYTREIGRLQTYVTLPDGADIPEFITELTGIKTEDLRGASTAEQAITALWYFARRSVVVAQNAPFDLSFIRKQYTQVGGGAERGATEWFACTRAMSRLVDPDEPAGRREACKRYGIPLNGHHRAMNDVEATLQLYAILKEKAEVNGITYHNVVVDSEERPLIYTPPGAIVRTITKPKEAV